MWQASFPKQLFDRLHRLWHCLVALLILWQVLRNPSPVEYAPLTAIIFKVLLFLVVMGYLYALTYSPLLWLEMILATPRAMLHFCLTQLILPYLFSLISRLSVIETNPYARFRGQRPFQSGRYALSSLFSITAVPYRLYPLSCCLLE